MKFGLIWDILIHIFSLCEFKRIALAIFFRFNAISAKRHSSVTAEMSRFLTLEKRCYRLSTREWSFCPYFAQTQHIPISITPNTFMLYIRTLYRKQDSNYFQEFCAECLFAWNKWSFVYNACKRRLIPDNIANIFWLFGYSSTVGKQVSHPLDNKTHLLGADSKSRTFPESWKTE